LTAVPSHKPATLAFGAAPGFLCAATAYAWAAKINAVWKGFGEATFSRAADPKTGRPYTIEKDGFRLLHIENHQRQDHLFELKHGVNGLKECMRSTNCFEEMILYASASDPPWANAMGGTALARVTLNNLDSRQVGSLASFLFTRNLPHVRECLFPSRVLIPPPV
jgi:hypothetical protein